MTTDSRAVFFDIFCGETDGDAKWVEGVEGLAAAVDRMNTIAEEKPGVYFVFDRQNRKVLARANSKNRYKPNASDVT